ncbi:DUF2183 domain-containing protein [Oligoflexaceae bacterium]|nr:DUF2183 domain-containing protein [Oligoflexaceae bacterium]
MPNIWSSIRSKKKGSYDLSRLIDFRKRNEFPPSTGSYQVICDIDKTYLETKFETFVDILQVALEAATSKQTVEGASDILMAARFGNIYQNDRSEWNGLHFVSSSPPQLRAVLEEKLMIDGLEWDSDTFKNQAYNLLKGKMGLLRQHLAYKSAAILNIAKDFAPNSNVIFIGDNAESDPMIYLGAAQLLNGGMSSAQYFDYLKQGGVDEPTIENFAKILPELPRLNVQGIIIRNAPGYNRKIPTFLNSFVRTVDHFFEMAFLMHNIGLFSADVLVKLTKDLHNFYAIDRGYLCSVIEAAGVGREESSYVETLKKCFAVIKSDSELSWKKDVSRDLSPFRYQTFNNLAHEDINRFAKEWTASH